LFHYLFSIFHTKTHIYHHFTNKMHVIIEMFVFFF